jgi:hypothetical protein
MLRAQIELHFLFQHARRRAQLAEAAPARGGLTANLIAFLRGSLAEMRNESVTLAEDFAMIEAYLKVMQACLGERLQFALDLPGALAGERAGHDAADPGRERDQARDRSHPFAAAGSSFRRRKPTVAAAACRGHRARPERHARRHRLTTCAIACIWPMAKPPASLCASAKPAAPSPRSVPR